VLVLRTKALDTVREDERTRISPLAKAMRAFHHQTGDQKALYQFYTPELEELSQELNAHTTYFEKGPENETGNEQLAKVNADNFHENNKQFVRKYEELTTRYQGRHVSLNGIYERAYTTLHDFVKNQKRDRRQYIYLTQLPNKLSFINESSSLLPSPVEFTALYTEELQKVQIAFDTIFDEVAKEVAPNTNQEK
jgi:hypothetical protein